MEEMEEVLNQFLGGLDFSFRFSYQLDALFCVFEFRFQNLKKVYDLE